MLLIHNRFIKFFFIISTILLHSWTILLYASEYNYPGLTVCLPIVSEMFWMFSNNDFPIHSDIGQYINQYDIEVSIYLVFLTMYFLFNRASAVKCVIFISVYFLVWLLIYCLCSLIGLSGYSNNSIEEFKDLGYTAYYYKAVLLHRDWKVSYTMFFGWWITSLVIWIYIKLKPQNKLKRSFF